MQAYTFPKTSGARNPIVIVRIFRRPSLRGRGRTSGARNPIVIVRIFTFFLKNFIFLQLKVVLQAKPCKGERCRFEGLVQTSY